MNKCDVLLLLISLILVIQYSEYGLDVISVHILENCTPSIKEGLFHNYSEV